MVDFRQDGLGWKGNELKKGEVCEGHAHEFGHSTLCVVGKIEITREFEGKTMKVIKRPGDLPYFIEAGVEHQIRAVVTPSIYWCIYCSRDPETGEPVEHWNGWENAFR